MSIDLPLHLLDDFECLSLEELEAAVDMCDQLEAGTFYDNQRKAIDEMFGPNPNRKIFLHEFKENEDEI